jgi:hypothetical protein
MNNRMTAPHLLGRLTSGRNRLHRMRPVERAAAMIDRPGTGRRQGTTSTRPRLDVAGGVGHGPCWWRLRDPHQAPPERLATGRLRGPDDHLEPVATVLYGPVQDQAALYRLLDRIQSRPGAGRDPPATGISRRGSSRARPPTASSVAWCSTSIWSAPDGSGLLTFGCLVDADGSRRALSDRLDDQPDGQVPPASEPLIFMQGRFAAGHTARRRASAHRQRLGRV